MIRTIYIPTSFNDKQNPPDFGWVNGWGYPTFEEAKKELLKILEAELYSVSWFYTDLSKESIQARLDDAREALESPGDEHLSDYTMTIWSVQEVKIDVDKLLQTHEEFYPLAVL